MSATLDVYPSPVDGGDYLAVLKYTGDELPLPAPIVGVKPPQVKTIVILDNSGSMSGYVRWVNNKVLPLIFEQLHYNADDMIDLLLFESQTRAYSHKVSEFPTLAHSAMGGTDLRGVFPQLQRLLSTFEAGTVVRILAVSDGDVSYQEQTVQLASELNEVIQSKLALQISTTAVRIFTSTYANPDVRALSSLLQFTTSSQIPGLIDITPEDLYGARDDPTKLSPAAAATRVLESFGQDAASSYLSYPGIYEEFCQDSKKFTEEHESSVFKSQPWSNDRCFLPLQTKSTLFWLSKSKFDPTKINFTISDVVPVPATIHNSLSAETYEELIKTRVEYYMMQVKLLRVVSTEQSVQRLKQIADYFINLETQMYADVDALELSGIDGTNKQALKYRLASLIKQSSKTNSRLSLQMKTIANMDATATFNSAQAASFLRQTGSGSASKGLVRRAGNDLDFDSIVRTQVIEMAKNLKTLEEKITPEIEATFKQSFVSLATTMDGIRAICSLATTTPQGDEIDINNIDDSSSILDTLPALEILSFLNLVGVPVQSTIGDYPDPYRYNINVIFSGHYCSLSDLICHHSVHDTPNGPQQVGLNVPGYKEDFGRIDNVIPIFDHPAIFNFMWQYAPSVLNYYSSVGMRRVIADIPGTLPASLSAALLKMFRVVSIEPTEVNYQTLNNIFYSLKGCSTDKFNYYPCYVELFNAIKYIDGFKLGNYKALIHELNQADGETEGLVQLGTDMTADATTPATAAPTKINIQSFHPQSLPQLAQITLSLTQLLLPLLQLMIAAELDKFSPSLQKLLDENKVDGITPSIIKSSLPSLLRSIYANEVWHALRSEYRNKPDSTQIIKKQLNTLLGIDEQWKPTLTGPFEDDAPFDISVMPRDNKRFMQSQTFKDGSYKLQRLNILLALPFFAQLLSKQVTGQEDAYKDLICDTPKVITTNETVSLLFRAAEIKALQNHEEVPGYEDDEEYNEFVNITPEQQEKIDSFKEERNGMINEVNNNIQMLWPTVFYGLDNSEGQIETSMQHVNFTKLVMILYNYIYPQPMDRYPSGAEQTTVAVNTPIYASYADLTYNNIQYDQNEFLQFLTKYTTQAYENLYNSAVNAKIAARRQVFADLYKSKLLNTEDMEEFKTLLTNGYKQGQYSFQFENGFQDQQLTPFWKSLINKDNNVPHRLAKLEIIILGREGETAIWNKGRILYQHSLHDAAQFFYDADQRTKWIEICQLYADRRKWEYRESDLPNRHSHHLSKPSYWALGYDTLVDYQKAVDEETYKNYCKIHTDCCGLTPVGHKRQKADKYRHNDTKKSTEMKD